MLTLLDNGNGNAVANNNGNNNNNANNNANNAAANANAAACNNNVSLIYTRPLSTREFANLTVEQATPRRTEGERRKQQRCQCQLQLRDGGSKRNTPGRIEIYLPRIVAMSMKPEMDRFRWSEAKTLLDILARSSAHQDALIFL